KGDVGDQKWPSYDEKFLIEDEVEIVVQLNGKVRDRITMSIQATEDDIKNMALALPKIRELTAGKQIRKVVVIPKKLVTVVVAKLHRRHVERVQGVRGQGERDRPRGWGDHRRCFRENCYFDCRRFIDAADRTGRRQSRLQQSLPLAIGQDQARSAA